MLHNKVVMFSLLGGAGCLLGALFGEGVLLPFQSTLSETGAAPSLIARPELEEFAENALPVVEAPLPKDLVLPMTIPPKAPELPKLEGVKSPPPPPEFRKRLEREDGQQTGDIRVTLIWNNYNDLDLHCVDPAGEEIYYKHPRSSSGGELDVDENVDPVTNTPVENVYWPKGGAPVGTYRILVNHYKHHGRSPSRTPFNINLLVDGRQENFAGEISHGDAKRHIHSFSISPVIRLAVPDGVEVEQGGHNQIKLRIARERFREAVTIRPVGDHEGVSVDTVTIGRGRTEADVEIVAEAAAAEGIYDVRLIASGAGTSVEASIPVTVKKVPRSLVMATPESIDIYQGGSNSLKVRIARNRFDEQVDSQVKIAAANSLPGIGITPLTLAAGQSNGDIEVSVEPGVAAGVHPLRLTASGGGVSAEAEIRVQIVAPPPELQLAVPSKIEADPGGIQILPFRIRRNHFSAIVEANVQGDLAGIHVQPVKLPPGETEGEFEVHVDKGAVSGNRMLSAEATGAGVTAESPVEIVIHQAASPWSWSLIFLIGAWTALLAIGVSLALVGGQNRYLRRPPFTGAQVATLGVGGAAAGCLAGGLAQALLLGLTAADIFPSAGFIIGWALLGALLGYGVSFSIPNLTNWKASAAGGLGGFAGGVAFMVTSSILGDWAGRLTGAVALGAFIGLMVAFAEMAFRSAWLEVYRGKEMMNVTLGPEPVLVGSAKNSTVWIPDAPERILQMRIQGKRILFENLLDQTQKEVDPDFTHSVGGVKMVVRVSAKSGAAPKRPPPPPPPPSKQRRIDTPETVHGKSANAVRAPSLRQEPDDSRERIAPPPPPPPPPRARD